MRRLIRRTSVVRSGEFVPGLDSQQVADRVGRRRRKRVRRARRRGRLLRRLLDQVPRHLLGRQDLVGHPGRDRAPRHAVVGGGFGKLDDGGSTVPLDRAQASGAVGAGARQDDANGALALVHGERVQETIDRLRKVGRGQARAEPQHAVFERQGGVGRDDVNVTALDGRLVVDGLDGHLRVSRQQIGQHALVVRVEMLHVDHGDARGRRHMPEEASERLEAPCGRADAHDQAEVLVRTARAPGVTRLHSLPFFQRAPLLYPASCRLGMEKGPSERRVSFCTSRCAGCR